MFDKNFIINRDINGHLCHNHTIKGSLQGKVLSVNVNGIKSVYKRTEFHLLVDTVKPMVVIGCESKISPDIRDSEVFPANYTVHRRDRTPQHHLNG